MLVYMRLCIALSCISAKHLLFLHRLEDFDYAFLVVDNVYPLKHFTVFASANFPHDLVVVLSPVTNVNVMHVVSLDGLKPAIALTPSQWPNFRSPSTLSTGSRLLRRIRELYSSFRPSLEWP